MAKLFSPFVGFARFANEDPDNPGTQVILNYTRRIQVTPNIGEMRNPPTPGHTATLVCGFRKIRNQVSVGTARTDTVVKEPADPHSYIPRYRQIFKPAST